MKIDRNRPYHHWRIYAANDSYEHWWRHISVSTATTTRTRPVSYDDLFSVAKAFGVTADEVQALLDYGCSEEEIEEMLYDPTLLSRDDRRTALRVLRKGDDCL